MADKRISQLVERTDIANNDVVPIVASGATTTNKATISSIQEFMQENLDLGVTSVGITLGTTGTDVSVSGSPITTSGNITINIPTASATNRGLLSSADWTTFNNKQPAGNYVTLDTAQTITAQKTFTTSGSSDTMIISHGSGSGFALDVIKAGNGEAIRVTKTSGSGNAMSITGGNFGAEAAAFSGVVTTTPDAVINGVNVGRGAGNVVSNTRVGLTALQANTTGNQNTAVGTQVLLSNTSAAFNTGIGYNALLRNTTGSANTALGAQALVENTTGPQNTAVGVFALLQNTTAAANTAIGWSSLYTNTTGLYNTGLGSQTLYLNSTGSNNTAAGRIALRDNTTGSQNSAFGNLALYFNTTGSQNTGIGYSALGGITTGINNVAVGHIAGNLINSGTDNATSNNSVYIGQDTRASASGNTNEIVIGSAGRGNGSNTVTLGNDSITNTYLKGAVTLTGALNGTEINASMPSGNGALYIKNSSLTNKNWTFIPSTNAGETDLLFFYTGSGAGTKLTLASTGAATFSSSVSSTEFRLNNVSTLQHVNVYTVLKDLVGRNTILLGDTNDPTNYYDNTNHIFRSRTSVPRLIIDSSGNVGIGTDSPASRLHVVNTANTLLQLNGNNTTAALDTGFTISADDSKNIYLYQRENAAAIFATNNTERMRITSGGYLKASNTGSYQNVNGSWHEVNQNVNGSGSVVVGHSGTEPYGLEVLYSGADPNNASNYVFGAYTTSGGFTWIYRIFSNGTVSARSDARWKKNIETTRNGYIEDLCKLRVVKYNWYNHEDDTPKELGLIAQEVEEVFPNLIQIDPVIAKREVEQEDGTIIEEEFEDGVSRSIKTSVLPFMLLKAIQEQQAQIQELKTEIDSLKNQIK